MVSGWGGFASDAPTGSLRFFFTVEEGCWIQFIM